MDWSGDQPVGWRPHEDPASPIRVNPLVRFGMPAIGGISTEAIAGELDGGASLEEVADEALTSERGPFIWRVSRTAMTSIPLD